MHAWVQLSKSRKVQFTTANLKCYAYVWWSGKEICTALRERNYVLGLDEVKVEIPTNGLWLSSLVKTPQTPSRANYVEDYHNISILLWGLDCLILMKF